MSFLSADRVKVFAETLETERLSNAAAKVLAPHVEVRLREVVQEASKFARHSKRSCLSTDDINNALKMRNVEPTYGFASKDTQRFVRAANHSDLFYVQDPVLSCEQVIEQALPKPPQEVGVTMHWLAIDGVQPSIPENLPAGQPPPAKRKKVETAVLHASAGPRPVAEPAAAGKSEKAGKGRAGKPGPGEGASVQLPIAHVLSKELQTYFNRVADFLLQKSAPDAGQAGSTPPSARQQAGIFASLATDPGLHQAMPYFMRLISEEVPKHLQDLDRLLLLLTAARSLAANEHMSPGPYSHLLMPALLSCVLAKRIGGAPTADHWSVREYAARTIALVCDRLTSTHSNVQPRVTKEYVKALNDESKPLGTHYGAVAGLAALGSTVVRLLLVPHLVPYMRTLAPFYDSKQTHMRRIEAQRVFGALCHAACASLCSAAREKVAADIHLHQPAAEPCQATTPALSEHIKPNPPFAPKPSRSHTRTANTQTYASDHPQANGHLTSPSHPSPHADDTSAQGLRSPGKSEPDPASAAHSQPPRRRVTRSTSEKVSRGEASPLRTESGQTASPARRASSLAKRGSGLSGSRLTPAADEPSDGNKAEADLASSEQGKDDSQQQPTHPQPAASKIEHPLAGIREDTPGDGAARLHNIPQQAKALANAWREDVDPGQAVLALRELFGEPMLPHFWDGRLAGVFV